MAEGTRIIRPNRAKASSKLTRIVVALLLVISAVLVTVVTIGGWERLVGMKLIQIGYAVLYLVMAFLVLRWNRGVLPLAAALAIILAIFAGIAGPEWFARDKAGFTSPTLDEAFLGAITLLIIPVQLLLIVASTIGFRQAWNVEEEIGEEPGYGPGPPRPHPQPA
ncbi:MAG TPA: hypothetical protein VK279_08670 [Solirubrobacteraceae bacterium]|nr:hypothetical protein [Solirubrobacteraceae bacterium]